MFNMLSISTLKRKFIVYVVLTIATLAVYGQVHQFDFVNFDDNVYVTGNMDIQSGITAKSVVWAFTTKYFHFWNPLVWLSYMADYQLHGLNAGGFHITNLILHLMSVLLLFWLFNRMTGQIWQGAFVAALFALHPLHVESVVWIAERKDVLSAFFWMLTLCFYVYYTEKPNLKRYLPVLLFFACALMSKPMAVTLPAVMILLDYWPLNRLLSRKTACPPINAAPVSLSQGKKKARSSKEEQKKNTAPALEKTQPERRIAGIIPLWQLKEKAPFFLLSLFIVIVTIIPSSDTSLKGASQGFSLLSRLANAPVYFVMYLAKTLWPGKMAVFYPLFNPFPVWQVLGALALILVASALVVAAVKRMPYLLMGWLWFGITILPVLGIIDVTYAAQYSMADRYHYLPSIGLAVMLAWGLPSFIKNENPRKAIIIPAGVLILAVWSFVAWQQSQVWKNSISLFGHALRVTKDNYIAHHNLANALFAEGKTKDVIEHFNEAIRLKDDYVDAYYNRGSTYVTFGLYQEALKDFNKALSLKDDYVDAYNNRGSTYMMLGRQQEALVDFNQAIRLNDAYADAYNNRGIIFINQGDNERGCLDAKKACALGNCRVLEIANAKGLCF